MASRVQTIVYKMPSQTQPNVHRIFHLEGDGISADLQPHVDQLFEVAGDHRDEFKVETRAYNASYFERHGTAWPEGTLRLIQEQFDAVFMVALGVDHPVREQENPHMKEIIFGLRDGNNLGDREMRLLHPDLRPSFSPGPFDFYPMSLDSAHHQIIESRSDRAGEADAVRLYEVYHFDGIRNLFVRAAKQAGKGGNVIVPAKGNAMPYGHGPVKEIMAEVAKEYEVNFEHMYIDAFMERLVRRPESVPSVIATPDRAFFHLITECCTALNSGVRKQIPEDFRTFIVRNNKDGKYTFDGEVLGYGSNYAQGVQKGLSLAPDVDAVIEEGIKIAKREGISRIKVLTQRSTYPKTADLYMERARLLSKKAGLKIPKEKALSRFAAQAVRKPAQLHRQVFVGENLINDISGDLLCALVGGIGTQGTISYSSLNGQATSVPFAEVIGGSAPDIAGMGVANPIAAFVTQAKIFESRGRPDIAADVISAVRHVIARGVKTRDIGGTASTAEFARAAIKRFKKLRKPVAALKH